MGFREKQGRAASVGLISPRRNSVARIGGADLFLPDRKPIVRFWSWGGMGGQASRPRYGRVGSAGSTIDPLRFGSR